MVACCSSCDGFSGGFVLMVVLVSVIIFFVKVEVAVAVLVVVAEAMKLRCFFQPSSFSSFFF